MLLLLPACNTGAASRTCMHLDREFCEDILGPTGWVHSFHSSAWWSLMRGVCVNWKRSTSVT